MGRIKQMVKQLKFEGYSNEDILEIVKKCLEIEFDYDK